MKLGEIAKLTKDNNNTKQGKCQQVRKTPPFYLHNLDNYKQFMRDKGDSEEAIKHIGENQWKNAIYMWVVNYKITYNEPCPYKFPYEPWTVEQPELLDRKSKKVKQEKGEPVKQVRPEIRIHADALREIITMGLTKTEYEVFFIIMIEILQWKYHRDNNYTAKLGPAKIAKLSGRVRRDQAARTIKKLEEKGLIKIIQNKKHKDNRGAVIQLLKY